MKKLIGVLLVFLMGITPVYASDSISVDIPVTMRTGDGKTHQVTLSSSDAPIPDPATLEIMDGQTIPFTVVLTKLETYHYTLTDDQNETISVQVMVSHGGDGELTSTIVAANSQNKKLSTIAFPTKTSKTTNTNEYNEGKKPTPKTTETTENGGGTPSKSKSSNSPTTTTSGTNQNKTKKEETSPSAVTYLTSRFVKTGDVTHILLYICAFAVAALVLIVLLIKRKKKN